MLATREDILQDLVDEQFLCTCKYWHDIDLNARFNMIACGQVFCHLHDKLITCDLGEFKRYLKGFCASEYIKRLNERMGCASCVITLTPAQETNINFFFQLYKGRII